MKQINHEQMQEVGGAGLLGDVLGGIGNALDLLVKALLGGLVR